MMKIGTLLISHAPETSFPSDHTTFLFSIALMLVCFAETRKSGLMLLVLSLIGGVARVFCGVHFPLDIVGSIIVSILASSFIFLIKVKVQRINNFIINIYISIFKLQLFHG